MALNRPLKLAARIVSIGPEGPPARRLKVRVEITNPADEDYVLVSSWTVASFNPGGIAAEGALFEQQHAKAFEAQLPASGKMGGEFSIPISPTLIGRVEEARGNDVALGLRCRFLFAPLRQIGDEKVLGAPWESALDSADGQLLGQPIPQSEWVRYLREWQWREIELFELPFDSHEESPQFQRAFELVRVAEERLRNGDFPGVFQNCRQALEGLAKDAGAGSDLKAGIAQLLTDHVQGKEKGQRVGDLLLALNEIGHLGRHELRPHEDIFRKDALFILRVTLSAIQYLTSPAR